jgi:hypothetical protein
MKETRNKDMNFFIIIIIRVMIYWNLVNNKMENNPVIQINEEYLNSKFIEGKERLIRG